MSKWAVNHQLRNAGLADQVVCTAVRRSADHVTIWLAPVRGSRTDLARVKGLADLIAGSQQGYSHVWETRRDGRGFVIVAGRVDKGALLAERAEREKVAAAERAARWRLATPTALGVDTMCLVSVDGVTLVPGLGPHAVLQGKMQKRSGLMTLVGAELPAADLWVAAGLVNKTPTPDGILVSTPTVVAIRDARDGIAAAVSTALPLPVWEKALPTLRSLLHAPNLTVQQLKAGMVELNWHDSAPSFPTAVALALGVGATDLATARDFYTDWTVPLGAGEFGDILTWCPRRQPHLFTVGSTGGGKSVFLRGIATSAALAGAAIWAGDGKGSDYPALRSLPGVQMVASTEADTVVMVATLRAEMQRRVNDAELRKSAGDPAPYSAYTPIVLILDEFATVAARLLEHDKKGLDAFRADIAELLRVGREPRVHVVLASQELRSDTIPGSWQENLKTILSLGSPSEQTLRYAFPDAVRADAATAAASIPQGAKGRGLAVDADSGEVRLFQSYMQWSPGSSSLDDAPSDQVRAAWEQTDAALAAMPRLYPRMAISFDDPTYRGGDIAALRDLTVVPLDARTGPIADRAHLDPASPAYTGRPPAPRGTGLGWADDETVVTGGGAAVDAGPLGFGDDGSVVDTAPATPVPHAVSPPVTPPRVTGTKPAVDIPDDLF